MNAQAKLNNEELAAANEGQEVTVKSLFANESNASVYSGANQLGATARLTQMSSDIASHVLALALEDEDQVTASAMVEASQKTHDAADDLINEYIKLGEVEIDFLKDEDEETLDKMIRSQQSKRSRSKGKIMTKENYLTMMTGAVAENLLRLAANKPKNASPGAVMGEIGFSDEDLEELAKFPEELKKAIRNVQSKKSIMRSKYDFSEDSPRWEQLLSAEQQLKDVRDQGAAKATREAKQAVETNERAKELLMAEDISDMSPDKAKQLLDSVREMLAGRVDEEQSHGE